jgi:hypothetical protein
VIPELSSHVFGTAFSISTSSVWFSHWTKHEVLSSDLRSLIVEVNLFIYLSKQVLPASLDGRYPAPIFLPVTVVGGCWPENGEAQYKRHVPLADRSDMKTNSGSLLYPTVGRSYFSIGGTT